jgi:preprotein translocase SecE subunit
VAETAKNNRKRKVKNPETFRERAIKAADDSGKPTKKHQIRSTGSRVVTPVTRPIGKGTKFVFHRKPFIFIGKVLGKIFRSIGKILLPRYIRNSWKELKLVTWPSWQQSRQLTFAVIIFATVFGAVIAAVDFGLDKLFRYILLK